MQRDNTKAAHIVHPLPPLYDGNSKILILGSFPSVKTREMGFFYGHPQNRYWKVLSGILEDDFPETVEERRNFLLRHHIAAWDVIYECDIVGSSDASIRNVTPTDLRPILDAAPIRQIYVNGKTAEKMYKKYTEPVTDRPCVCLPSTSPANAVWSLQRLAAAWDSITPYL